MKSAVWTFLIPFISLMGFGLKGQEYIHEYGKDRFTAGGTAVKLGDKVYYSISDYTSWDNSVGTHKAYRSRILVFDQDGHLTDTLAKPGLNKNDLDSIYLRKIGLARDTGNLLLGFQYTGWNAVIGDKVQSFKEYDLSNEQVKREVQLDTSLGEGFIILQFLSDSNFTMVAGGVSQPGQQHYRGFYTFYDKHYNIIRSFRSDSLMGFFRIQKLGDKIFHFVSAVGLQFQVFNAHDLSLDTNLPRPLGYPSNDIDRLFRDDLMAVEKSHGPGFYTIAAYANNNVAVVQYDSDYAITEVDSFRMTHPRHGWAHDAVVDYHSPDSIYVVNSFYRGFKLYSGQITDTLGLTKPLQVFQLDTAGKLHWKRLIEKPGAIYLPVQVLATDDGGALIFSEVFDTAYSRQVHSRLSVIKIQGDGRILNERFYDLPQRREVSVYPNPVQDRMQLKGISLKAGQSTPYRIYGLDGTVREKGRYQAGKGISLRSLAPGNYLLRIQDKRGAWQTARFVKE